MTNRTDADALTDAIDAAVEEFERQRILEDFFFLYDGSVPQVLADGVNELTDSCFSVDGDLTEDGAVLEFFFSGNFPNDEPLNEILQVSLIEDGAAVASSSYGNSLNLNTRNFTLFYKTRVEPGSSRSYSLNLLASLGAALPPSPLDANSYSWGYRIYSGAYPLQTSAPTC